MRCEDHARLVRTLRVGRPTCRSRSSRRSRRCRSVLRFVFESRYFSASSFRFEGLRAARKAFLAAATLIALRFRGMGGGAAMVCAVAGARRKKSASGACIFFRPLPGTQRQMGLASTYDSARYLVACATAEGHTLDEWERRGGPMHLAVYLSIVLAIVSLCAVR